MKTETVRLREFTSIYNLVGTVPRGLEAALYAMGHGPYNTAAMREENKFLVEFNYGRNPAQTGLKADVFARLYGSTKRVGKTEATVEYLKSLIEGLSQDRPVYGHYLAKLPAVDYRSVETRALMHVYEDVVQGDAVVYHNGGVTTGRTPREPGYFTGSITPERLIKVKNSLLQRAAAERLAKLREIHNVARDKD